MARKYVDRMRLEQARRYAEADKSDPFAMKRILCHMQNGITGFTKDGQDAFYNAEAVQEERSLIINGREEKYNATVYKNRVRP